MGKRFDKEFKIEAVRLASEPGNNKVARNIVRQVYKQWTNDRSKHEPQGQLLGQRGGRVVFRIIKSELIHLMKSAVCF